MSFHRLVGRASIPFPWVGPSPRGFSGADSPVFGERCSISGMSGNARGPLGSAPFRKSKTRERFPY
jgi:hypothetical protein